MFSTISSLVLKTAISSVQSLSRVRLFVNPWWIKEIVTVLSWEYKNFNTVNIKMKLVLIYVPKSILNISNSLEKGSQGFLPKKLIKKKEKATGRQKALRNRAHLCITMCYSQGKVSSQRAGTLWVTTEHLVSRAALRKEEVTNKFL